MFRYFRRRNLALHGGKAAVRNRPLDPSRGSALIGDEEKAAVLDVLGSRSLYRYYGPREPTCVTQLEKELAAHVGTRHALAVSSGTAALRLALIGLGIRPGDEVIVPAVTFIATAGAVVAQGAVPVFAEVDDSFTIDPEDVGRRISPRTKAIMPVHLFGVAADMKPLTDIARVHGLHVIEDAAQACGVSVDGRKLGSLGSVGAFSFQFDKHITSGEGGALVTDDAEVYRRAAQYHDQGGQFALGRGGLHVSTPGEPMFGENLRLTEIAGAILRCQLRRLDGIIDKHARARTRLLDACRDLDLDWLPGPISRAAQASGVGFAAPSARLADAMVKALCAEGVVASRVYGGRVVYDSPLFRTKHALPFSCAAHPIEIEYQLGLCPRSEDLVARAVVVFLGPLFSDEDLEDVAEAIRKVCRAYLS